MDLLPQSGAFLTASQSNRDRVNEVAVFACVVLVFYGMQVVSNNNALSLSNWFVSDGMTLANEVERLTAGRIDLGIENGQAVSFPYYFARWGGNVIYFVVNLAFLLFIGWRLGFKAIVVYPYYLVAMALPSKDILILFATIIFITALLNKRLLWALLVALLSYFIRDGSFFVFISILLAFQAINRKYISATTLLGATFVFGAFLFSVMLDVFGGLWIVERNYTVYEANASSILGDSSPFYYFVRVFGNITNLAFRPALIDQYGGISILAVAYFVSGISMVAGIIYSVRAIILDKNVMAINLSVFYLVSLAVISLSPHIQGRYQFPFGVVLSAYMFYSLPLKSIYKYYLCAIVVSALAVALYLYSSIPYPPPPMVANYYLFG